MLFQVYSLLLSWPAFICAVLWNVVLSLQVDLGLKRLLMFPQSAFTHRKDANRFLWMVNWPLCDPFLITF